MVVGDGTLLTAGYTPHTPHQQQPHIENLPQQPGPSQVYYQNNNSVPAWYSNANNSTLHPTFQSQAQHSRLPAQNYDAPGIQREPAPPIRQPYYYPARPVNPASFRTPQPYAPGPRQQYMVDYRIPGASSYQQNSMHHFGPPPSQAYPGHHEVLQPSGATTGSPQLSQQPTYHQPTYQQGTQTSSYPFLPSTSTQALNPSGVLPTVISHVGGASASPSSRKCAYTFAFSVELFLSWYIVNIMAP